MSFINSKITSPIFTGIFITSLILLLFISSISYRQMRSTDESGKQVTHTYRVQLLLAELFSDLKDAESSQRGYILTHDSTFMKQMNIDLEKFPVVFEKIRSMTVDNKAQQQRLGYLNALIKRRIEILNETLAQSNRRMMVSEAILTSDALKSKLLMGKNVMDLIRREITEMGEMEMKLLKDREEKHQDEIAFNPIMLFLLAFFSLIVFIASFYKINKDGKELKVLNQKILNRNRDLEQQILSEFTESFAVYKTGDEFFNSLTKDIAAKTGLDYVLVGELAKAGDQNVIKTFSFSEFGQVSENIQYALAGGPSEQLTPGNLYSFPAKCRFMFESNRLFQQFKVEGYIAYALSDAYGNAIGLIAVMDKREIKEINYVESLLKIAAKRAELELDRTLNSRLLAAKNLELERQNTELASFNHVASHDLQEPLRKIQTFISRISEKETTNISPTGKEYFERIQISANRMQMLIDDLLTFSRTNKADQIFESVDLNVLLENAKHELAQIIEEKDAHIQSVHLPTLNVIPFQFQQLLINLISNSLKYSKPGITPLIRITVEIIDGKNIPSTRAEHQKKYYKISFIDNGVGFEQQYAENIFVLFQRLHGRSEYTGTGIGLAICKKIVENHQGFITAEGKPNTGAAFHVFLPAS
ncbi:MAG: hypothetical protein JWN78_3283 [Bacteroidota bacterium]|nr:hypothetical protein [Bacteroidota bacterium]